MFEAASLPIIGLDIAKSIFQVYQVDSQAGEIRRHQVRRAKVLVLLCHKSWADSSLKCNTCHRVRSADAKHPIQALSTAPA